MILMPPNVSYPYLYKNVQSLSEWQLLCVLLHMHINEWSLHRLYMFPKMVTNENTWQSSDWPIYIYEWTMGTVEKWVSIERSGSSYSTIPHVNIVHREDLLIKLEYT